MQASDNIASKIPTGMVQDNFGNLRYQPQVDDSSVDNSPIFHMENVEDNQIAASLIERVRNRSPSDWPRRKENQSPVESSDSENDDNNDDDNDGTVSTTDTEEIVENNQDDSNDDGDSDDDGDSNDGNGNNQGGDDNAGHAVVMVLEPAATNNALHNISHSLYRIAANTTAMVIIQMAWYAVYVFRGE